MNRKEARYIITKETSREIVTKAFKDCEVRLRFLQKWVKKYTEEMWVVKDRHARLKNEVSSLPFQHEVVKAKRLMYDIENTEKEIKKLKRKVSI